MGACFWEPASQRRTDLRVLVSSNGSHGERGARHRTVCNLGKLPGLDQQHRHGWEDLIDLLEGTEPPPKQQVLRCLRRITSRKDAGGREGLAGRKLAGLCQSISPWPYGGVLACMRVLEELMPRGRETVSWPLVACVHRRTVFIVAQKRTGDWQRWYQDSALAVGWTGSRFTTTACIGAWTYS